LHGLLVTPHSVGLACGVTSINFPNVGTGSRIVPPTLVSFPKPTQMWHINEGDCHSNRYEDGCQLGYNIVYSGRYWPKIQKILLPPWDSKLLWNVGQYLLGYTVLHPRRQPFSFWKQCRGCVRQGPYFSTHIFYLKLIVCVWSCSVLSSSNSSEVEGG
jgi:hypothetical protein